MWPVKIVSVVCLTESLICFVEIAILSMERNRNLDKDLPVLLDSAKRATVELAAVCWIEVQLCYDFIVF